MCILPIPDRLASASVVFFGPHGDITAGGVQRGNRLSGSGGATGSSGTAASGTICGKGLQLRGRTQQRGADATKPAPQDDARVAGPQKAVLEPADISHGQTPEDKYLPAAGSYPTVQPLLVAVAPTHTRSATRTIVRPSWCHLRKSRNTQSSRQITSATNRSYTGDGIQES